MYVPMREPRAEMLEGMEETKEQTIGNNTHQSSPRRNINLNKIITPIPRQISGKEASLLDIPTQSSKSGIIGIKNNAIRARDINTDAIIREALRRVEIEDPQQARAFKDEDLVILILQTDVRLRGMQPAVFGFGVLHRAVEVVEESVA